MELSLFNWFLSALPILLILGFMLILKWSGVKAGFIGWVFTVIISLLFFGANLQLLIAAQIKAVFLSLDILYLIWTALFLFRITEHAGMITIFSSILSQITDNKTLQALILAWLFTSFLQGFSGYGVPVAITAPLLVSLGFSPVTSVLMASIGHGWSVTFGTMSTAYQVLIAVTNTAPEAMAQYAALLLGISAVICGLLVAGIANDWKNSIKIFIFVMVVGIVLMVSQYVFISLHLTIIAVSAACLIAMSIAYLIIQISNHRKHKSTTTSEKDTLNRNRADLWLSTLPYVLLFGLTLAINGFPIIQHFFNTIKVGVQFPVLTTTFGWTTPAESSRVISLFGHPGALILYTCLICYWVYRKRKNLKKDSYKSMLLETAHGAFQPTLAIFVMLGIATTMSHVGMNNILAKGMSQVFNAHFFPIISPFIGALGSFITGSNNNSNVLFGLLQMQTAQLLNLSVPLILAAQTAGASLGSIIMPAKVMVGCSTVGLTGKENTVIGKLLIFGMIPILIVAMLTFFLSIG